MFESSVRSYPILHLHFVKQFQTYSNVVLFRFIEYSLIISVSPVGGMKVLHVQRFAPQLPLPPRLQVYLHQEFRNPENLTPTDSSMTFGRFFRKNKLELDSEIEMSRHHIWPLYWASTWDLLRELEKPIGADWIAMNRWRKLRMNSADALSCGQQEAFEGGTWLMQQKALKWSWLQLSAGGTNVRIPLDFFVNCTRFYGKRNMNVACALRYCKHGENELWPVASCPALKGCQKLLPTLQINATGQHWLGVKSVQVQHSLNFVATAGPIPSPNNVPKCHPISHWFPSDWRTGEVLNLNAVQYLTLSTLIRLITWCPADVHMMSIDSL